MHEPLAEEMMKNSYSEKIAGTIPDRSGSASLSRYKPNWEGSGSTTEKVLPPPGVSLT